MFNSYKESHLAGYHSDTDLVRNESGTGERSQMLGVKQVSVEHSLFPFLYVCMLRLNLGNT